MFKDYTDNFDIVLFWGKMWNSNISGICELKLFLDNFVNKLILAFVKAVKQNVKIVVSVL